MLSYWVRDKQVMSLEDALGLVGLRARLIEQLPAGGMTAVPMAEETIRPYLGPDLAVAAINGHLDCVVSGEVAALEELERRLAGLGVPCLRLPTRHAFHSPMLAAAAAALTEAASRIELGSPSIPYPSNLTGRWLREEEARDPGYWARHMCEAVLFAEGLDLLLEDPNRLLLEVGPGQSLSTLARRSPRRTDHHAVLSSLRHRDDRQDGLQVMLSALGRLWVAGVPVDWEAFHQGERRRRIPLPTYPFERRRYWIEPRRVSATPAPLQPRRQAAGEAHTALWHQSVPPVSPPLPAAQEGPWLLLGDGRGLAQALAERLRNLGGRVVTATSGPIFATLGEDRYQIDPRRREDYAALLAALAASASSPAVIVYLLALDAATEPEGGDEMELGLYGVVRLLQAAGAWNPDHPYLLTVVADGLVEVTGQDRPRPYKAALLGACRVGAQEYAQIRCRVLDVTLPEPNERGALERLAGHLAMELAASGTGEALVAYRGERRWTPLFEPVSLPAPAPALPDGAVLITGGLGGVGLTLAESLARLPGARLALLGRTPLPDRDAWESWLAEPGGDPAVGDKIRKLLALEALGAQVLVLHADVTDEEQMRRALDKVLGRFGRIGGVIHAAGVAGGGLIQLQTREKIRATLAPKVEGARLLDRLLAGEDLDFFVVFSSILATLGGIVQMAYSAANCFLEAFAQERASRTRGRTVAMAWDRWLEVGMAAVRGGPAAAQEETGFLSSDGVATFWRALAGVPSQVVVLTRRDFQAAVEEARSGPLDPTALETQLGEPAPPLTAHPRPELQTPYVTPSTERERRLVRVWEELLGIDRIGVQDNFFELGGDSLRGIQVAARARRDGLEMTTQLLFQYPTIADLAARLGDGEPQTADIPARSEDLKAQAPAGSEAPATLTPEGFPHARLSQGDLDALLAVFDEGEE